MLRTLKIGLLGGVLFALSGSASFAATYDVANDFSITNNGPLQGNAWSYGWAAYGSIATPGYTFNIDTDNGPNPFGPDIQQWRGDQPPVAGNDGNPSVFKNVGPPTSATLVPSGTVGFHPGAGGEYAIIRWTAPTAGTYSVGSLFNNYGGGGTDVHVLVNGVEELGAGGRQIAPPTPTTAYASAFTLAAGGTIDFAVGYGSDKNFGSDTTGLVADITAIPEPAYYQASALLAFGGMGLLRLRRRKTA